MYVWNGDDRLAELQVQYGGGNRGILFVMFAMFVMFVMFVMNLSL